MYIQDNYLILENEYLKMKKITGTTFVSLCDKDRFNKKGDTILGMMGLYKSDVDPKYLRRGDLAEDIVRRTYLKYGHNPVAYDKKSVNYDNFENEPLLGGLIDLELPDEKSLIEVKSKSMSKYLEYQTYEDEKEIFQGEFYAYLRNYDNFYMEWIFFDKPTEDEVFAGKKPTTLMNLKRISKSYKVDRDLMDTLIDKAQTYRNKCYKEKRIPIEDCSPKVLQYLKDQNRLK